MNYIKGVNIYFFHVQTYYFIILRYINSKLIDFIDEQKRLQLEYWYLEREMSILTQILWYSQSAKKKVVVSEK